MLDERQQKALREANEDTRKEILSKAKIFEESGLYEHPGWKLYEEMLRDQMQTRITVLQQPLSDVLPGHEFSSKVAQMESVKGALIALRLAINLPRTMIESAEMIRKDESKFVQPEQTPGEAP